MLSSTITTKTLQNGLSRVHVLFLGVYMLTFLSFNNRINVQESPWGRVGKIQRHVLMVVEVEQGSMIIFMSYKENIL